LNPGGVAAEGTIKEQEEALSSTFNRKAAIENAEHILTGKMAEIKQRWIKGKCDPAINRLCYLSPEAIANADYVRIMERCRKVHRVRKLRPLSKIRSAIPRTITMPGTTTLQATAPGDASTNQ